LSTSSRSTRAALASSGPQGLKLLGKVPGQLAGQVALGGIAVPVGDVQGQVAHDVLAVEISH
jgi:hypothetical protein